MFYENSINTQFSFEGGLSSSTESEARHLINRLRLEFRTASQRQLEDAVSTALQNSPVPAGEKVIQLARASLEQLLTPALERVLEKNESTSSEPPFRAQTTPDDLSASPAS